MLIRHGQTEWNLQGRLQGRGDSPLTALGLRQARALAPLVARLTGRRLSSPQPRAARTAGLIFGAEVPCDPRLAEICVGRFSGRTEEALRLAHPSLFAGGALDWYDRCPEGEGFAALEARCRAFLDDLDGPVIAVTHGITLRMLRRLLLGLPPEALGQGTILQGGAHLLRKGHETLLVPPPIRAMGLEPLAGAAP